MTEISIGGAQSYTLPLESVDLTYLSKYVKNPREETKTLWSKKCLDGESEYFQIHILAEDINEDDCYFEPSVTYKCHICNLDVPKTCYKQHIESEKHITYKKISEKVLQQVSKQINVNMINNDGEIKNDTYYCMPCSKVIQLKNKYKHEASDYHSKSQKNINTVSDFYKIFNENDNNDGDDEETHLESNKENLNNDLTNNNSKYITKNNLKECRHSILDSDDDNSLTSESDEENNEYEIKSQSMVAFNSEFEEADEETSFEEYLKEMIEKYRLKVNLHSDCEFIYIETPIGDKLKVSREAFHSYVTLKNSTFCQMCYMRILEHNKAHDVSEIHVRNIFKPVNEKFARPINAVWSHCLVCNEVVSTVSNHHTLTENHKKLLKNMLTQNSQYNDIGRAGKTLCGICNAYVDTHNFFEHTNSKKHKIKKENIIMERNHIHEMGDKYFCNFCNVLLTERFLNLHINQDNHLRKKNETEPYYDPNSEYCEICKVDVPNGGMVIHKKGNPHTNRVISELDIDLKNVIRKYFNETQATISSEASMQNGHSSVNTFKNNSDASTSSHTVSSNATKNSSNNSIDQNTLDTYYNKLVFADGTKTKLKCKVCNVNIPNNDRNVIEHMEGRNHLANLNKQIMGPYEPLLQYTDNTKKTVKCIICDVPVPLVQRNIFEHLKGRQHDIEKNLILNFHTLNECSPGLFYCECCDIKIEKYFIDHINSEGHTEIYQNKYEIDKKILRKCVYEDDNNDKNAPLYRDLYNNLLLCNEIDKLSDGKFYCNVCEINLGRISEIDHMLGERHRSEKEQLE